MKQKTKEESYKLPPLPKKFHPSLDPVIPLKFSFFQPPCLAVFQNHSTTPLKFREGGGVDFMRAIELCVVSVISHVCYLFRYLVFSIIGLLCLIMAHMTFARSHMKKFVCVSLVNKKLNLLIPMFSNHDIYIYVCSMKQVEEDTFLLIIKACARYFLSNFYFSSNNSSSKNYEKWFLFDLKSSFCSRDIQIFVFLSSPLFFLCQSLP